MRCPGALLQESLVSTMCCSVLQCTAVCCGVFRWPVGGAREHRPPVAVRCSVLQCVAMCCSVLQCVAACCSVLQCVAVYCSVSQSVAVYLFVQQECIVSLLHGVAVCCNVCCSVLQCVAVCCSVPAGGAREHRQPAADSWAQTLAFPPYFEPPTRMFQCALQCVTVYVAMCNPCVPALFWNACMCVTRLMGSRLIGARIRLMRLRLLCMRDMPHRCIYATHEPMTHLYAWHASCIQDLFVCIQNSFVCVTSLMYTGWRRPTGCLIFTGHFPQKSPIIIGSFAENDLQLKASYGFLPPCMMCTTWIVYMCDVTHSCIWHDPFICVTWLIHICGMSQLYVRHDSCMCCDITHSYVQHDSFTCVQHGSFTCATWQIRMHDIIP